jgi:hypothetical protein
VRDKFPEHLHELRNTATKPIEIGAQHNANSIGAHQPHEHVRVTDDPDVVIPTLPPTKIPKRIAVRTPRKNHDHALNLSVSRRLSQAREPY